MSLIAGLFYGLAAMGKVAYDLAYGDRKRREQQTEEMWERLRDGSEG